MSALPEGLLLLGFGGHARSVADVALAAGVTSLLFVDERARPGEHFAGHPVVKAFEQPLPSGWACFPCAGDGRRRREQVMRARAEGWPLASVLSPCATIGAGAVLEEACFVAHHAHVGPMARVGEGTIINTGGIVEHDCRVGSYCHVSVHTTIAGWSVLGDFVFAGAGATVIDRVEVASDVVIGAGSVVVASLHLSGTYAGVPANRLAEPVGR